MASGSVVNPPGTSTGVPSNMRHSFHPSLRNPKNVSRLPSPTTSPRRRADTRRTLSITASEPTAAGSRGSTSSAMKIAT